MADFSSWTYDFSLRPYTFRPIFLCHRCRNAWVESYARPWPGIDRPAKGADENWRPSIMDAARHAIIAENLRKQQSGMTAAEATETSYVNARMRQLTKQQRACHAAHVDGIKAARS